MFSDDYNSVNNDDGGDNHDNKEQTWHQLY